MEKSNYNSILVSIFNFHSILRHVHFMSVHDEAGRRIHTTYIYYTNSLNKHSDAQEYYASELGEKKKFRTVFTESDVAKIDLFGFVHAETNGAHRYSYGTKCL